MAENIKQYIKEFEKIEKQRIAWLRLSILVAIAMLAIVLDWTYISNNQHLWFLFFLGLGLSIVWWYWTMNLVKKIIRIKQELLHLVVDLTENISNTRSEITKLLEPND
jgi:predicted membrane channel-forming protein YqfA (hemolysin III family)